MSRFQARTHQKAATGHTRRHPLSMKTWRQRGCVQTTPPPPLGDVLATIYPGDLVEADQDTKSVVHIDENRYLASYNWLNGGQPRILIPGEPPSWMPPSNPIKLKEDSGEYFRDKNAARYPDYPLEPMVQAILTENPGFKMSSIDIVACGSTLGNLLRFVRGADKPFRMLVEVIGSTAFFMRRENSPTEKIPDVKGYGHTFPESYTTWSADVKGSESHQRVISYNFAGFKLLVRSEVDGYLPELVLKEEETAQQKDSNEDLENDVFGSFAKTSISNVVQDDAQAIRKPLELTKGGSRVPQDSIFDLKTRSIKKKDMDTLGEELPRLWLAQIPNFIIAYHTAGVFNATSIHVCDVREDVRQWEKTQQEALTKFASLLKTLVSFARSSEVQRLEIVREEGSSVLELRTQCPDAGRVLSPSCLAALQDDTLVSDNGSSNNVPSVKIGEIPFLWGDETIENENPDYTACSAASCGYCGHCRA